MGNRETVVAIPGDIQHSPVLPLRYSVNGWVVDPGHCRSITIKKGFMEANFEDNDPLELRSLFLSNHSHSHAQRHRTDNCPVENEVFMTINRQSHIFSKRVTRVFLTFTQ